jgi:hypothetical protein
MFRAAIKSLCGGYYIRGRLKPSQTFLAFFQFGLGAFRGNGHKHWLQIESGTALDRIWLCLIPFLAEISIRGGPGELSPVCNGS